MEYSYLNYRITKFNRDNSGLTSSAIAIKIKKTVGTLKIWQPKEMNINLGYYVATLYQRSQDTTSMLILFIWKLGLRKWPSTSRNTVYIVKLSYCKDNQ